MVSQLNVVDEIKLDHNNVRDLFERFKAAHGKDERAVIANTLIREMSVHGEAEEISVYNEFPKYGLGDVVGHNKQEHADIKRLVYEADVTPASHDSYDDVVTRAVTTFLEHAGEEEADQLAKLQNQVSAEESDRLAREFLAARRKVPTRAHPAAPQTGGAAQKAAGGAASLVDKAVESLGGREFVDLKYQHPE
ncbi:hypothetical protein FA95DRAFT_823786 [Auriscalpium vulgare]|uniref:Uncharacterized protein n=1 Tax=Auriscalpium vulgare TaxID=40419 RepID=A0ACB8RAH5_9AGAM|nr:hypothetical protein FA95DRAFT_823786 [Auriscalpium vulgare]